MESKEFEILKMGAYSLLGVFTTGFGFGAVVSRLVPDFASTVLFQAGLVTLGLLVGFLVVSLNEYGSELENVKQFILVVLLAFVPYLVVLAGLLLVIYRKFKD